MSHCDDALIRLLDTTDRIVALDDAARSWLTEHAPHVRIVDDAPCEIALGIAALHGLDAARVRAVLFHARTYLAPSVLVIAHDDCVLSADDFRALAFEPLAHDASTTLYQFNLATYKPVPDWLNSRFWAHPDNWDN
jgi:hypothetical protein